MKSPLSEKLFEARILTRLPILFNPSGKRTKVLYGFAFFSSEFHDLERITNNKVTNNISHK